MPLQRELTEMTTTSPVLASFDWKDLVTGNGFIDLFPNFTLGLTSTFFFTNRTTSSGAITIGASTRNLDTSPFGTGIILEGIANFTIFSEGVTGGNFWRVRLYKVVGGTPTAISAQISVTMETSGNNNHTMAIPLTSRTIIGAGDVLRLELINTIDAPLIISGNSPKLSIPVVIDL